MYDIENGYSPRTFDDILQTTVDAINLVFNQNYTTQSIVGTNFYKFYYVAIQLVQECENGISELSEKLIDYIRQQNEKLEMPRSTVNGFLSYLESELGIIGSFKPMTKETAGQINLACDVDSSAANYNNIKTKICAAEFKYLTAGLFYNGTERQNNIGLNGQVFETAYELPETVTLNIQINIEASRNTLEFVPSELAVASQFKEAFESRYRLGQDFNPATYWCPENDLSWAGSVEVLHSTTESDFVSGVWKSEYNQKIELGTVSVTITQQELVQE